MKPLLFYEHSPASSIEIYYLPKEGEPEPNSSTIHYYNWHREDGPAYRITRKGTLVTEVWWYNGLRHRLNGAPADRNMVVEGWFIMGANITHKVLPWFSENGIDHWSTMTDNEKILFNIRFWK